MPRRAHLFGCFLYLIYVHKALPAELGMGSIVERKNSKIIKSSIRRFKFFFSSFFKYANKLKVEKLIAIF